MAEDECDGFGRVFGQAGAGVGGAGVDRAGLSAGGRLGWLAGFRLIRLGIGGGLCGAWAGRLRPGAGFAGVGACGAAWGGGAGAEFGDVGGGAALPGAGAGQGCEAEVAEDVLDDVVYGPVGDLGVEVWGVHAVEEFGVERLGGVAVAVAVVVVLAPEGVLDGAQDALAGGGAVRGGGVVWGWGVVWGRGAGGRLRGVQALREHDAAADGAADVIEGGGGFVEGVWRGAWRRGGLRVRGLRSGGSNWLRGLGGLGVGLVVQEAGDAGAHADEIVQGCAVAARGRGVRAGVVLRGGLGGVCRHERNKNIV